MNPAAVYRSVWGFGGSVSSSCSAVVGSSEVKSGIFSVVMKVVAGSANSVVIGSVSSSPTPVNAGVLNFSLSVISKRGGVGRSEPVTSGI